MKNENLLPNEVVPKEIRLEVYKEALGRIERNELGTFQLCILLPCILWGLEDSCNMFPNKRVWFSYESCNMFPELSLFLKKGWLGKYANEERIKFLKTTIRKLSKQPS